MGDNENLQTMVDDHEEVYDFDRDSFLEADKEISSYIRQGTVKSGEMKDILDEFNDVARNSAASQRFTHPVAQFLYKSVLTLTGKDAVAISSDMAKSNKAIAQECKKTVRNLNNDINLKSKEYERMTSNFSELDQRITSFELGITGYQMQLQEINDIIVAKRNNQGMDCVELQALDPGCLEMDVYDLDKLRVQVTNKVRNVELELSTTYFETANLATQMEQNESTMNVLGTLYKNSFEDLDRMREQQSGFFSPDYVMIWKQQIESAKLQENAEKNINSRAKVVEDINVFLSDNLESIMNPYKANYNRNNVGSRAGKDIEEAFDSMAERGEVGMESLRTRAHAALNKYLS